MASSAVDGGGNNSVGGEDIKFSVMVSLFQWIQKSKSSAKKRSKFRKFIDTFCRKPQDNFAAMRLILPGLDRERGSYGLKEHVLATCLIDALAMSRDSDDARRLLNWRKGGPKTGSNAGNFSLVAAEVLQRRQGMASAGLTIKELNDFLDHLVSSENRAEKTSILSDLIRKTNAQEMKWIIMIILKDLKLGISEKSIFDEFHPDAEDLFNVTCDLKLVCEKLKDRSQRHKRQTWNPIDNKKFETLSYLPPQSEESIAKEVDYMIKKGWIPCLEFDQVGYVYRQNSSMPGYYDGRYWTLWKLPMFGCNDSSQVLNEIQECKKAYPNAFIRCLAFDNVKQAQCMAFLIQKPAA